MPSFQVLVSNFCKHSPKIMSFSLSLIVHKSFDDDQALVTGLEKFLSK